ncbi:hypothetical protein [Nocardia asteroides]|uniref:hypothetical protein n=1 Tax=Nocardia asteroides TaxID=1824 RepID=UPI003B3AF408
MYEGQGVGTALVDAFRRRATAEGATQMSVVLDTEPGGRWRRRKFFQSRGFTASTGSALHFHRQL